METSYISRFRDTIDFHLSSFKVLLIILVLSFISMEELNEL